jgi:hypothetical protein
VGGEQGLGIAAGGQALGQTCHAKGTGPAMQQKEGLTTSGFVEGNIHLFEGGYAEMMSCH